MPSFRQVAVVKQANRVFAALLLCGVAASAEAQVASKKQAPPAAAARAPAAPAADAVIRVACDSQDTGALIYVNGQMKGDCPIDIPVVSGTLRLRVVKKVDEGRERVFERELVMGAGTSKRVDVEMSPTQLTAEGRKLEDARLEREKIEAQRRAEENLRLAQEKDRAEALAIDQAAARERARIDPIVTSLLEQDLAQRHSPIPDCRYCVPPVTRVNQLKMEIPASPDPVISGWLQQAQREATAYLASGGADFRPPAQTVAMPCDGAELAMQKLAGLSELTAEQKKEVRAQVKQEANSVTYQRDIKVWPVKASCQAGVLNGPLEFWAFGTRVMGVEKFIMVHRTLSRYSATMESGTPTGVISTASKNSGSLTHWYDPATSAMMNKDRKKDTDGVSFNYSNGAARENSRSASITIFPTENDAVFKDDGVKTSMTVPRGNGSEMNSFTGMRAEMQGFYRNGKPHGAWTSYGHRVSIGAFIPDMVIPTTVTCYRDGVVVNMTPCNVN